MVMGAGVISLRFINVEQIINRLTIRQTHSDPVVAVTVLFVFPIFLASPLSVLPAHADNIKIPPPMISLTNIEKLS